MRDWDSISCSSNKKLKLEERPSKIQYYSKKDFINYGIYKGQSIFSELQLIMELKKHHRYEWVENSNIFFCEGRNVSNKIIDHFTLREGECVRTDLSEIGTSSDRRDVENDR